MRESVKPVKLKLACAAFPNNPTGRLPVSEEKCKDWLLPRQTSILRKEVIVAWQSSKLTRGYVSVVPITAARGWSGAEGTQKETMR